MKNILLASLLFFIINLNAQTIKVEYEVILNRNTFIRSTKCNYDLIISNNKSIYYNDYNNINVFPYIDWKPEVVRDIDGKKTIKVSDNILVAITQDYFYKDYNIDTLLYNDISGKKKMILGESINLFNWEIIPESDTIILNYKCQKAICNFRGRDYEAFFSSDIVNYGGPWKFDGLPGLILSVRSKFDYFIINPVKLTISAEVENVNNPYENIKKILSWDDFKIADKENKIKILKILQADARHGETSRIIIKDRIEDIGYHELSSDDL